MRCIENWRVAITINPSTTPTTMTKNFSPRETARRGAPVTSSEISREGRVWRLPAVDGRVGVARRQRRGGWLGAGLGDQARAGGLDAFLDQAAGLRPGQARRDRVQNLDHNRSGIAAPAAARPEQTRIQRQGHA